MRDQTFRQIGINMTEAKKTLPATSPVNTTILKHGSMGKNQFDTMFGENFCLLSGVTNVEAGGAFQLSARAVANAKSDDLEKKDFSQLSLPKFEREKMTSLRPLLKSYFATIEPVSGVFFRHFL